MKTFNREVLAAVGLLAISTIATAAATKDPVCTIPTTLDPGQSKQDVLTMRSGEGSFDCGLIQTADGTGMMPVNNIVFYPDGSWVLTDELYDESGSLLSGEALEQAKKKYAPDIVMQSDGGRGDHCASYYTTTQAQAGAVDINNIVDASTSYACTDGEYNKVVYNYVEPRAQKSIALCSTVGFACPQLTGYEKITLMVMENYDAAQKLIPGKGFLGDDGNIDLGNICHCFGPSWSESEIDAQNKMCNQDPRSAPGYDDDNDPSTPFVYKAPPGMEGIETCFINNAIGANPDAVHVPMGITLTNPTCFTFGGSEYCY